MIYLLTMELRKITDSVFYCGVNDRTTHLFENLWPLPFGVSYNSYFVAGKEKTALIDTVEEGSACQFVESLRKASDDRRIDYLVVNHVEPDHSGGIRSVVEAFPGIKIIGNKTTITMIKGFYGIDDSYFMEVKEGDSLDLGGVSLQFIMTPMVHWPETMMTYMPERKLIFAGDAFGCFGALNGGVLDSSMDTDVYFPEMYRYYANIVGKYGRFVQKALDKARTIEIEYICSTHGPVWHERIKEIVDIYDRLSRYEGEEGVTIIYGSMYGNTGAIAEIIAKRLNERGVRNIKIHNASKSHLSYMITDAFRYKGLIVGAPTYSTELFPPVDAFMKALEVRETKNKVMGLFGSFTWASTALNKLKGYAERMGIDTIASLDMKQAPDTSAVEAAKELADRIADQL